MKSSFAFPVYDWLEHVPVHAVRDFNPQALHILGCQAEADDAKGAELGAKQTAGQAKKPQVKFLATLPDRFNHALQTEIGACGWHGKRDSLHVVVEGFRFLLVPTSLRNTTASQAFRQVGLLAARRLEKMNVANLVICADRGIDVFDGLVMGLYRLKFDTPSSFAPPPPPPNLTLPSDIGILGAEDIEQELAQRRALALSITYARTLQDLPPNWLHAPRLANIVQEMSRKQNLNCEVYGQAKLEELGMGAFLAVAQGEQHEPRMLVLKVQGKASDKKIALVGKGITFDTGGMNLKRRNMEEMKYDMSGAAAVLGAMHYFAQVQPDATVIGIVGATENAISSKAMRPSDIVTAYNGKSIEILDTDAEGRLLLADLLAYAAKNFQPDLVIDIATLTGAVAYALGRVGAGFYSNSESAAKILLQASVQAGEPFCRLPIWDEVQVDSKHADWKNIDETNTESDGMFAASFLQKFVEKTDWLHLDIAGTAADCQAVGYPRKGGCAYGIRTFVELCSTASF